MSLRPVHVNLYERAADVHLRKVCEKEGARVLLKVRVADVVDLAAAGLSGGVFTYGLKAHLDYLVVDEESSMPLFAVELDGYAAHSEPKQIENDRMKDAICAAGGLELLRVTNRSLDRFGPYRVLSYLVECWFLARAFDAAQERGEVPWDEPFIPKSFLTVNAESVRAEWPYAVNMPVRVRLQRLYEAGRLPSHVPQEGRMMLHADDADAEVGAYVLLALPEGLYLLAEAAVRSFRFRAGVGPDEIAQDLAMLELDGLLNGFERGDAVAVDGRAVAELRVRTHGPGWVHDGMFVAGWS